MKTKPTRAELIGLVVRAKSGDRQALAAVVEGTKNFVWRTARRYEKAGVPIEDLVQEGFFGVVRAIEKFDAARGCSFLTYLHFHLRNRMRRLNFSGSVIRTPTHGRSEACRAARRSTVDIVDEMGGLGLVDRGGDPAELAADREIRDLWADRLRRALARLPARERMLLWARANGSTLREIGRWTGRSRERVRQWELKAHELLRELVAG